MHLMDSFALGYIKSETKEKNEKGCNFRVKVNVNLWIECGWKIEPVLDIGFMLYDLQDIDDLLIYIPFKLCKNEVSDLCKIIANNSNLLGAIFNEPYCVMNSSVLEKKKKISVDLSSADADIVNNKDVPFWLYCLDPSTDMTFESFPKDNSDALGTFIKINAKSIVGKKVEPNITNYYIRFRIKSKKLSELLKKYDVPNVFESVEHVKYLAEFRFNNTRSMANSLVEKFIESNDTRFAPISSLHLLLMTQACNDVDNFTFKSSRVIEENIWNAYVRDISNGEKLEDIVAYHSKYSHEGKQSLCSYEFFTKIKVDKSMWRTIFVYLISGFGIYLVYEFLKTILVKACECLFC